MSNKIHGIREEVQNSFDLKRKCPVMETIK